MTVTIAQLSNDTDEKHGSDGFDGEISDEQAVQAWKMMDGNWSETEFMRRMNVVRMQDRYPQLKEVVMKLGRVADNNGRDRLTVSDGSAMKISHSSGSDIEGITIGYNNRLQLKNYPQLVLYELGI